MVMPLKQNLQKHRLHSVQRLKVDGSRVCYKGEMSGRITERIHLKYLMNGFTLILTECKKKNQFCVEIRRLDTFQVSLVFFHHYVVAHHQYSRLQ